MGTSKELENIVNDTVAQIEAAVAGDLYDIDGTKTVIDDVDAWKRDVWLRSRKDVWLRSRKNYLDEHPELEELTDKEIAEILDEEVGAESDWEWRINDPWQVSLRELLEEESLGDVRFDVNQNGDLFGGKIVVAFGGPNVWVADDEVRGYWGSDECRRSLSSDASRAVFEWFEEQWACARQGF